MWVMTMKMRLKMKNRSHRYDIRKPRPSHGHKYTKYKMYFSILMVICLKQHLSNIWSSIHVKVKQHWGWIEKCVAYTRARSWHWLIQIVWETGIPVWESRLCRPTNTVQVFSFQLYFSKKCVDVAINVFTMHLVISKCLRRQKCRLTRKTMRQQEVEAREETACRCFHSLNYVIDHSTFRFFLK